MGFSLPPSVLRFRPLLVILAPIIVLVVAFMVFIQPRLAEARLTRSRIAPLQQRVESLQSTIDAEGDVGEAGAVDVMPAFERLTTADARVPALLERLAQLLGDGVGDESVQNLVIDSGLTVEATTPGAFAQDAAGGETDPRLGLFDVSLSYTPVTVTFESSYARLGQFLWDLRDLPILVEVRSLEVEATTVENLLSTRMVMFAYRREPAPGGSGPQARSNVDRLADAGCGASDADCVPTL